MMRKTVTGTIAAVIAAVTTLVAPAAAKAAPYCGISWGSTGKDGIGLTQPGVGPVINVRADQHDCYDRLVIDFSGGSGRYDVHYVHGVSRHSWAGDIPLRGRAFLNVVLRGASSNIGAPPYSPADQADLVSVAGWQTLRQVSWGRQLPGIHHGRSRGARPAAVPCVHLARHRSPLRLTPGDRRCTSVVAV